MISSNVLAEVCYAGIVGATGVREYFKSKSKLSLIFGLYCYVFLTVGAYRQSLHPNRCSIFKTTSGIVAIISSVITVIIRMSIVVDSKFYKRHESKFKTYGMLSLVSIFRYNMAVKGCRGLLLRAFFIILYGFLEIFKTMFLILTTREYLINYLLNMLVILIASHFIMLDNGIELFDHRFVL